GTRTRKERSAGVTELRARAIFDAARRADHDRHGIIRVVPLRSRKTFVLVVLVLLFIVVGAVSYVGWRQSVRPPSVTSAAPRMLGHKTTVPMTLEAAHGNVAGVEIRVVQGTKQAVVLKQDGNL